MIGNDNDNDRKSFVMKGDGDDRMKGDYDERSG